MSTVSKLLGLGVAASLSLGLAFSSPALAAEGTACNAPDLPVTGNRIVNVATETQLQTAMSNLQSGDTILLAPGTYNLSRTLYVNGRSNVTIRGANGCDNVVLVGKGMDNATYGNVPFGIWSNSLNTTVAHLTIRDTWENLLIFNSGAQAPHVYSVKLLNSGSQFIKANPTGDGLNGIGVDNAVIEYSWVEYTGPTPSHAGNVGYTNGISAHTSDNWVIRGNLFKNIHNPDGSPYPWNPAVLMWNRSTNTVTEDNVFINVDRAIAYGLLDRSSTGTHDHTGGVIRNNFVTLTPGFLSATRKASSDAPIVVWDSPGTDVYHNTILTNGNMNRSIEFRFPSTTGAEARNNLTDLAMGSRDGASFTQSGNFLAATPGMFVNPAAGNLHLLNNSATQTSVLDKVPALPSVLNDIDDDARPVGAAADVGADEWVAPTAPADTTAPVVTTFTMPASATSRTVPVTAFAASDAIGVTGYLITENSTRPAAGAAGWQATPPTAFTFSATGTRIAYAWAKDAAGNVSTSRSATVVITLPGSTPTPSPSPTPTITISPTPTGTPTPTPTTSPTPTGGPDTIVPTVAISSPADGAVVRDAVTVSVTARDNVGVANVELMANGRLISSDQTAPYSFRWNSRPYRGEVVTLTVRATDLAGNWAETSIEVTVTR